MSSASYPVAPAVTAKRALVVGADPDLMAFLSRVLEPELWVIRQVSNSAAALAASAKEHFGLIITGEKTSGREDVELLRRIRRVRPHSRLIILASESTPADVIDSMRERAFSYFPFRLEELAAMIQRAAEVPCWDDGIEVVSATPEWIRTRVRCDLQIASACFNFSTRWPTCLMRRGMRLHFGRLSRTPSSMADNLTRLCAAHGDAPRR
jgi:CheY-like chemotaxis protein